MPDSVRFQLFRQITKKQILPKYEEGVIAFPPTYKFDINTDVYDTRLVEMLRVCCEMQWMMLDLNTTNDLINLIHVS